MPTRQIYWNIEGHAFLYVLLLAALAVMAYGVYRRVKLWRMGQPDNRWRHVGRGLADIGVYCVLHRRILQERYPGCMHVAIFLGFIFLAFATMIVAIHADLGLNIYRGGLYLFVKFTANLFGLFAVAGIVLAAWRRYVVRPQRLDNKRDDAVILALIGLILTTGFLLEGARLAVVPVPWENWEFVGKWVAGGLRSRLDAASLLLLHRYLWWIHLVLVMAFIGYLPYSKLFHIVLVPLNHLFRKRQAVGVPDLIDFDDENLEKLGKSELRDFSWKTLFDADACVRCGRCQDQCPAFLSGKHLNPKQVVQNIKTHMEKMETWAVPPGSQPESAGEAEAAAACEPVQALIGDVIPDEDIWSCTTCRSCEQQCPAFVEHVDKFIEMRRHLVMMEQPFPAEAKLAFRNMENNGNPWGIGWDSRGDYVKTLGVSLLPENREADILYWPGCSGAFDGRNQKVARAFVRLMQDAQINFAILGAREKCCGDPARRLGNEYLYESLATENIAVMKEYGVKKIVTQCPHCFHVLKNEYPQLGADFTVLHHSEFLLELIKTGRLALERTGGKTVTYHDSCYLGRYNQLYHQPRDILQAAGFRLKEMPHRLERSFCCGAGGGRMWLEERSGQQINEMRAGEAMRAQADMVGTACPFCLTMIGDGLAKVNPGGDMPVLDIAEILEQHIRDKSIGC